MARNIRWKDYVISLVNSITARINVQVHSFLFYTRNYKNYLVVMRQVMKGKYPITAELRTGGEKTFFNHNELRAAALGLEYDSSSDVVSIYKNNSCLIRMTSAFSNGDIFGIFLREDYRSLPVRGKLVIDVGANIADSSIYFASRGASKVVALEPFPYNYAIAEKNIHLNNMEETIDLLLAGASSKSGNILIPDNEGNAQSMISNSTNGINVSLLSLDDLLNKYHVESAVLKLDCEGCEYDVILNARSDVLRKFSHIHIEYHYGYMNLKSKLEESGFQVMIGNPIFTPTRTNRSMYVGHIHAVRMD